MTAPTIAPPEREAPANAVDRQRRLVQDLIALAAERNKVETTAEGKFATEKKAIEIEARNAAAAHERNHEATTVEGAERYEREKKEAAAEYERQMKRLKLEFEEAKEGAERETKEGLANAKKRLRDTRWESQAVSESSVRGLTESFDHVKKEVIDSKNRSQRLWEDALVALRNVHRDHLLTVDPDGKTGQAEKADEAAEADAGHAEGSLEETPSNPDIPSVVLADIRVAEVKLDEAEKELAKIQKLFLPKIARTDVICWPFIALGLGGIYPLGQQLGWAAGAAASIGIAAAAGFAFGWWFIRIGTAQARGPVRAFEDKLTEADAVRREYYRRENKIFRRQVAEAKKIMGVDLRQADLAYEQDKSRAEQRLAKAVAEADEKYPLLLSKTKTDYEAAVAKREQDRATEIESEKKNYEETKKRIVEDRRAKLEDLESRRQKLWEQIEQRWKRGMERAAAETAAVNALAEQSFPDWNDPLWQDWKSPTSFPALVPFGETRLSLTDVPDGQPKLPKFQAITIPDSEWPAAVEFPGGSLLLRATGGPLAEANRSLEAMMLRLLTGIPPGKVRFTIVDPVGLGQNFAAFMHLADYEEALVHNRIWTEPMQIEQALTDLTEHMETVIQKYLRNEFSSIEQYNEEAGEVAEPYRYVVVANFPVGFTEAAARRLQSIVQSGLRCGVQVLMTQDSRLQPPNNTSIADFERHMNVVAWTTTSKDDPGRWMRKDPALGLSEVKLAAAPDPEFITRILHQVGKEAKEASRVQVPFEMVAPTPDKYWTSDSSKNVVVPLGRAGATKLQALRLGEGTSQHVLIAGRTGSGKSTLLHALVTNLALYYSPQEVEVYLIDFKKGVEFKTYATHALPHARVIAIESEREFGLSVMQRLDAELKLRGDLYRKLGCQDLAGYRVHQRQNKSLPILPRILLLVDEFQEFFIEDDRIAQECSLLLDRLVRQGRAFGIHVHLGSQTLGGAYSLARSTLGQMAIRIALQCSESDAHLILAEDNSAARLLGRPGEAIYNDSNGSVEGNSPFQVVWLPDERREMYLQRIHKMAEERGMLPKTPAIVFEGNAPADIHANAPLTKSIESPTWPTSFRSSQAWLGEAIAIKDPTSAEFHGQSGSNLLIIGQQPESSLAMTAVAAVSLASQLPPLPEMPPRVTILNGMPTDSPNADLFGKLDERFASIKTYSLRDYQDGLLAVWQEVEKRSSAVDSEHPPIFLVVFDLPRFRGLRKAEDDFGFGAKKEGPPEPGNQLTTILRDGPGVGVHLVVWCDTLNNLNRAFDRTTLREFDMRVLFQMSGNDSSALVDSPAANKLGYHRALFVSEEQGRLEKFRPYAIPDDGWIEEAAKKVEGKK
jgi:S-DNA-T family DNA segregation ATPase FtsK/SpoIIIE